MHSARRIHLPSLLSNRHALSIALRASSYESQRLLQANTWSMLGWPGSSLLLLNVAAF